MNPYPFRAFLFAGALAATACSPGSGDDPAAAAKDKPSKPVLSIAGVTAAEGDTGTTPFAFRVTLNPASAETVVVRYRTQADTATADGDYADASGELKFAAGETEKVVTVEVAGDLTLESDETFAVRLNGARNAQLGADSAQGVIVNDDNPVVSVGDAAVAEGTGGTTTLEFVVRLSTASPQASRVRYATADGSARAPSDYAAASGTVSFAPGETEQRIAVAVTADAFDENDEQFTLSLANPEGLEIGQGLATGTIRDDDDSDLLRVGAAKRSVAPSQAHIDGVMEARPHAGTDGAGAEKKQQFGLGGNGLSDLPNSLPSTDPHIGNGWAKGNYRGLERNGTEHSTYVRALVIEEPDGDTIAFVTLDAIGAGNIVQKHLKAAVTRETGIPADNILFGQTHSHAAADLQGLWGGVPATWLDCDDTKQGLDGCGENGWSKGLYQLAAEAVKEALGNRVPATLKVATGMRDLNSTRANATTPTTTTDKAMTVLEARPADDASRVVGTLLQYAAHPTTIDNRYVNADYVLAALIDLETEGGTALYYNGPIADAKKGGSWDNACSPGDTDGGYCSARGYGRKLAAEARGLLATGATAVAPTLNVRHATKVMLPVTNPAFLAAGAARMFNRYYNFVETPVDDAFVPTGTEHGDLYLATIRDQLPQATPFATTTVSRVTLGDPATDHGLEIATIPGEGRNSLGQLIRHLAYGEAKATKPMMLLGLTHNSFGYIVPEQEFGGAVHSGELYEEVVSLGPLTAPLLRLQAYLPLFDAPPEAYAPEYVAACQQSADSNACVLQILEWRYVHGPYGAGGYVNQVLGPLAAACHENLEPPFDAVCGLIDALAGLMDGEVPPVGGDGADAELVAAAADAATRGCDLLDPAHCLFPFPSDHFTAPAADGSPQGVAQGGTGKRINFNLLAMPRNRAGKPIDPSEWNRNDGYSPGQLIMTYVPGIATVKDANGRPLGPIAGAAPLTDVPRSLDADAPILVLDTGPLDAPYDTPVRHPVWAEINLDAGYLLPMQGFGPRADRKPALLIRPARNFEESHRYVVVLRSLQDDAGAAIAAQTPFRVCRDDVPTQLLPVQVRCDALEQNVFPVLAQAGVARDASLYLAWDFTVASAQNDVARLEYMRDDAFASLGDVQGSQPGDAGYPAGRAPSYQVIEVVDNPDGANGKTVRRIRGSLTVPSYVVPHDPSPLDGNTDFDALRDTLRANNADVLDAIRRQCGDSPVDDADPVGLLCDLFDANTAASGSLPPNRLNYAPDASSAATCDADADQAAGGCALQARYGDGLPDRNPAGDLTTTFTCNIPRTAVNGAASMDQATAVSPVRPTLYGHGLLGGHGEGNGQASDFGNRYGLMTCMTDWFGFASGDVPNVASALVDLSNFPVIPDGTQQGVLNQLFLARLAVHPQGFAADPLFQAAGRPVFDRREVFYHGNSQGGIVGGVVVAASKDVNRGVLGVPGMNYSTLLSRSTDFALYSVPLYLSYQDDLDRPFVMSLMQMLWDRSENNGYAAHITRDAMGGPDNAVLLQPAFGDHQVTMWSVDVMARTLGARVDRQRVDSARHPDVDAAEYALLEPIDYANPAHAAGSALVPFDEQWLTGNDRRCNANTRTDAPPIGNVPPNRAVLFGAGPPFEEDAGAFDTDAGADPHECPRRDPQARCQMSHFLKRDGALVDPAIASREFDDTAHGCPAVVVTGAPGTGSLPLPADELAAIREALAPLDDALDPLPGQCRANAGPASAGCVVFDGLANAIANETLPPAGGYANASCVAGRELGGNRSYQVVIGSDSGERISFQVLEPAGFDCAAGHPLIVQGHGFGGSRSTGGFADYRNAGYAVISVDQRGFGASSGTVRVMDPDYEGRDLVRILDWAEANLDYLAYRDGNLLAGAIGGSYGGGFQFLLHNVDPKQRLDALAPDITWHDLRYSLNPGDTLKSAFGLLLTAGGERGSYAPGMANNDDPAQRGVDPYVKEVLARAVATGEFPREALEWFRYHSPTYWCDLNQQPAQPYGFHAAGPADPNTQVGTARGDLPGAIRGTSQGPVDILISQGFRDTLFNFNDAWWNYQCARVRGGDVRLITHQGGHILDMASLAGLPRGTPLDIQAPPGSGNCGALNRGQATVQWFGQTLRGGDAAQLDPTDGNQVCLSLSDGDAIYVPEQDVLAPRAARFDEVLPAPPRAAYYPVDGVTAANVPHGAAAQAQFAAANIREVPTVTPLLTVTGANGVIVAGIAQADLTLGTPAGANDAACAAGLDAPTTRSGCDATVFVGLGMKRPNDADWILIDDQITPVRGLGAHAALEFAGVAERLPAGTQLALMTYGYHRQYVGSYSRDATLPVVNVAANLKLPLYALDFDGQPLPGVDPADSVTAPGGAGPGAASGGLLGAFGNFMATMNDAVTALIEGDTEGAAAATQTAAANLADDASQVGGTPGEVIGTDGEPADALSRARSANREVEAVVLTGDRLPGWSAPAATGVAHPYPSGSGIGRQCKEGFGPSGEPFCEAVSGAAGQVAGGSDGTETRDAHNGRMIYPVDGLAPAEGVPVDEIAAYAWKDNRWQPVPVQVDERMPYFLANGNSDFAIYSGTDQELSYVWTTERWNPHDDAGGCRAAFDAPTPDPVPGLDHDDEIVFMAKDAGGLYAGVDFPPDWKAVQAVTLADPLDAASQRYVYLVRRDGGSASAGAYVSYQRHADADQWIDRGFFENGGVEQDPYKRNALGTSNTGYGPNLKGTVCPDGTPASARPSNDRFPRDGVVVSTDQYRWEASGRWMVRDLRVRGVNDSAADPAYWQSRPDLVDRWKGRAFQQSPDSVISLVGFEDEQVNWEANSTLLGERCGAVRCIREVWGADSGTNVTKTETFYRDAITYRYRVRVHPIPPDGLYTSWDYNRGAMLSADPAVEPGRYYTVMRPQGVAVDGVNDDIGQADVFPGCRQVYDNALAQMLMPALHDIGQALSPITDAPPFVGTTLNPYELESCAAFFDAPDPTFNAPLSFGNWEQVSGKGGSGSLVYTFELKGATSAGNPAVAPYYRDDECLDDGTGDDPVRRPWPGESYRWNNGEVQKSYNEIAGEPRDGEPVPCSQRQGAYAAHGLHFFVTHDSDNALAPATTTEIDGQQWQFMVPTARPQNVAEPYANVVRVPLQATAAEVRVRGGGTDGETSERGALQVAGDFIAALGAALSDPATLLAGLVDGVNTLVAGIEGLLTGNEHASVLALADDVANSPADAADDAADAADAIINGYGVTPSGRMLAGVGVVDMTPDVGYGTGQHGRDGTDRFGGVAGGEMDPYLMHKKLGVSHGVQSRLTARAIVVEGGNGKRIALLKTDNYLAQDTLVRRVAQLLREGSSGIGYDQILYHVTHDHSSAYNSTPAAGVWAFQDAFDPRFFEFQARKMAQAIELAAADLKPARMGAIEVKHTIFKGNVVGRVTADDGTPAGYPEEYGDHGLVVMRFDQVDDAGAFVAPIAVWVNWGEHPESLSGDGYQLHSADYVAPLERFVEDDIGAPLVFSQGDVGSAEKSGNAGHRLGDDGRQCSQQEVPDATCEAGGVARDWNRRAYNQHERNVRYLADSVRDAWHAIGAIPADSTAAREVQFRTDIEVNYANAWVPGPLSHPYPSVSNCRSETTAEGNPGVVVAGLPDCAREDNEIGITGEIWSGLEDAGIPADERLLIWETLKAEGVPLPEHYDAPSLGTVEENARLKLQAFQLGDVLLASCACEAQVDLILNLESRLDAQAGKVYDGFDWACLLPEHEGEPVCQDQKAYYDQAEFPTEMRGSLANPGLVARMRAQVHNDAAGWDAPEYLPYANAEPANAAAIKGNFTKEEIQDLGASRGFRLPVGIGHAGDYNGYTVSYREYMRGDHYRKALTAYGPHTADYMATRLVRMAAGLRGGKPFTGELHDTAAVADEARMEAQSRLIGQVTERAYEAYYAALPPDVGPVKATREPVDIGRFNAATFAWRGGSTAVDNPQVDVETCAKASVADCAGPDWVTYARPSGEVQTRVNLPQGVPGTLGTYAAQQEWIWTANFEAYESFPARLGSTPAGHYRFAVRGCINDGSDPAGNLASRIANFLQNLLGNPATGPACLGGASAYALVSKTFEVFEAADVVSDVSADAEGDISFDVSATSIPRSYASVFPFITLGGAYCDTCSFRPWARADGQVASVTVQTGNGTIAATGSGTRWTAGTALAVGESATITVTYTDGRVGRPVTFTREGEPPEGTQLNHYLGSLHEHSGFSDGTIGTTPANYYGAGRDRGLAFMAGAEHSDNAMLPITAKEDCASEQAPDCVQAPPGGVRKWAATATLASQYNNPGVYSAIRGFEWTSDRFGHLNVFFSANDLNAKTGTGYALSMEDFWQWLALPPEQQGGADGLVVFNHPGREDRLHATSPAGDPAYAWNGLEYRPEHDARVVGIEAYGKDNHYYDADNNAPAGGWYAHALDQGWHVGAVGAEDEHGTSWGGPHFAKTVILATRNTHAALREAMAARRFYALAHGHGAIRLEYAANGQPMGSRLSVAAGTRLNFAVTVTGSDAAARIEVIGPHGVVLDSAASRSHAFTVTADSRAESWRFVRVLDANGKVLAVSSPIWFKADGSAATGVDLPGALSGWIGQLVAALSGGDPAGVPGVVANGAAGVAAAAFEQSPLRPGAPAPGGARFASDCSAQSWIGGTTEICDGVLTYRDYVYDDHGADTQALYNAGYGSQGASPASVQNASPGGALSPYRGDATYPAGQLNTADLVKLELRRDGDSIAVTAELNTLFPTSTTRLAIAVDADDDTQTGAQPLLGLRAAGADAVHVFEARDAVANTITGSFPLPASARWKVWAVVAQGNGTVMNVAFRGTEEEASGLTGAGLVSGTWWEDKQARALAAGDISAFGHRVATADLVAGVDRYDTIKPGLHERIYLSQYTLGEGISAGGIPGRGGKNNYPCEQLFHFLGKYQPYGLYIPESHQPSQQSGLQLALHGCGANHASLINARGMQMRFGEELNRVLVVPLGRGPQGFNSDIAERDVLDVLDDVQANYAIDPDQVFSGGYSMGGYGAMRFAALYPDRFAGAVNWVGFTGDIFNAPVIGQPFEDFTNSGGFSNSSAGAEGNMVDFIGNLRHVPMASLYSGADYLVSVNTGLALMERFRNAVNVPYRFFFHPAAEHLTFALADDWRKEAGYLKGRKRAATPAQVTFRTDASLDYPAYGITHDRAYWISGIKSRAAGYADLDLVSRGCAGASAPVFTTIPDAGNLPAGADPAPWVAEYRAQSGAQPLGDGQTLMGTLRNVSELTVDVAAACLGPAATFCVDTDGPVTLKFSDGRAPQALGDCAQPAPPPIEIVPPEDPVPPGRIGIPGIVEVDPAEQCGWLLGFEGCRDDLPF